ncbi:MAG: alpha/beta fold hydrolase [archaeon]|nr:alpha/beta fold hydrolase [archaeon]
MIMEKFFVSNDGVELEAEYYQSSSDEESAIITCHPHPQFGGDFNFPIVSGVHHKFIKSDISSFRFNFRGVGRSTGSHTSGRGELSDVKACIDYLLNDKGIQRLFICGYSYGAAIGCSTINYSEKIIGYVAISLPWDFMGPKYKKLSQSNKPKLFIQGDRDDVAHYANFENHYSSYEQPKEYIIVEGADHFYRGYEDKVASDILEFYMKLK